MYPEEVSQSNFCDSEQLISLLVALIIAQHINETADHYQVYQLKLAIGNTKCDHHV